MSPRHEILAEGVELWCGDMLDILPTLGEFDACVTDPPYGIEGTWSGGNTHGWGRFRGEAKPWDVRPDGFAEWVAEIGVPSIVWGGQYFLLPESGSWLVWDKLVREFSSGHCELAWTNLKKPVRAFNFSHGQLATEGKFHPTQKPLALMLWCIDQLPADIGTILDPFMGSGTTGVAAIKRGKAFYGIEREPKYFEIALRRITEALNAPDMFVERPAPPKQEAMF
jgi:site-specific DNA-methyltransferase (adenine-specific)